MSDIPSSGPPPPPDSGQNRRRSRLGALLGRVLRTRLRAVALLVLAVAAALFGYLHLRSRWPESLRHRLTQLKASGVPLTLGECDRKYRALGNDQEALNHFQKTFAAMSKERPPLMAPERVSGLGPPRTMVPKFSAMADPEQRAAVALCLQTNAQALLLLHEGLAYERCRFPVSLADGFKAPVPHLKPCEQGAHLLDLESLDSASHGDMSKAGGAILASLHMAEILNDEPTTVGVYFRNRILAASCLGLRECLRLGPLSSRDIQMISTRLRTALAKGETAALSALVYERCAGMSIFQSSDTQIADFLSEGRGRFPLKICVEILRTAGILQRDAAFFLNQIDQIEAATQNPSRQRMAFELAKISAEIDQNQHYVSSKKTRVNIVSCMLLPGIARAMQRHLWTETLGKVALTSLAVERYRKEIGSLPPDLESLIPRFMPGIPEDPYTGQPLGFRILPKGYAVFSPPLINPERESPEAEHGLNELEFRVER